MKLNFKVDLTKAKESAENEINEYFNTLSVLTVHRDQEHKAKREIANAIINDPEYLAPEPFSTEAALMNISELELARQISEKPDEILARGLRRRTAVLAIRNAKSPAEIEEILAPFKPPKG